MVRYIGFFCYINFKLLFYFFDIMKIIGKRKLRILEEIEKNPSHGYELANRLGVSLSSIYEHLKDLREYKLVEVEEQEKRKVYRITEKGRYLLKALR